MRTDTERIPLGLNDRRHIQSVWNTHRNRWGRAGPHGVTVPRKYTHFPAFLNWINIHIVKKDPLHFVYSQDDERKVTKECVMFLKLSLRSLDMLLCSILCTHFRKRVQCWTKQVYSKHYSVSHCFIIPNIDVLIFNNLFKPHIYQARNSMVGLSVVSLSSKTKYMVVFTGRVGQGSSTGTSPLYRNKDIFFLITVLFTLHLQSLRICYIYILVSVYKNMFQLNFHTIRGISCSAESGIKCSSKSFLTESKIKKNRLNYL